MAVYRCLRSQTWDKHRRGTVIAVSGENCGGSEGQKGAIRGGNIISV